MSILEKNFINGIMNKWIAAYLLKAYTQQAGSNYYTRKDEIPEYYFNILEKLNEKDNI